MRSALIGSAATSFSRIVFDTNVVVSTLVFGGRLAWLRAAWANGSVVPLVSRKTTAELLRVLAYPKFRLGQTDREDLLGDYLPFAEVVRTTARCPDLRIECRDQADAIFIHLAIAAHADLLVSGDRDLTVLRASYPVPIASAAELKELLGR